MLEPTLSLIAMPREQPRRPPTLPALRLNGWIAAAPFVTAALWAAAVGVAFLGWAVTGDQAPLDWLRAGKGLIAAASVMAAALLAASLDERLPARRRARARCHPRAPAPESSAAAGWQLEEGRFELV